MPPSPIIMTSPFPVTFVNGFTQQPLCTAVLPALPFPGDNLLLDALAYQVTGHDWQLTSAGEIHITCVLLPQVDQKGERPFSYPEESELAALFGRPQPDRQEP